MVGFGGNGKAGDVRLMIDTADLMEQLTGHKPIPPNHSSFAMLGDSSAEVGCHGPKGNGRWACRNG